MKWFGDNEYYFEQLREFVPRDSLAILEQQKQRISQSIATEVTAFGEDLAKSVKHAIEEQQQAVADLASQAKEQLDKAKSAISSLPGIDPDKIAALTKAIDEYEAKWKGYGEKVAGVVKGVIKASTGLTI